jgi:outer membrane protein OmpA-like peptidoglycan-associated protein
MTLFGAFNEVLTPEVLAKIALYEDEPAEKTTKAVEGLVHTVFGGLLKRTTTEIGVNQLFSQLQRSGYDGSLSSNLNSVLKDATQTHAVITTGNEAISRLLPAMKSSIAGMISSYAGIRNSSAISLLGLTAGVVLDVLGRQVKEKKLDADGLAASLFDQREAFINAVPESLFPQLVEKVGIQQIVAGVAAPAKRTSQALPPRSSSGTATRPIPSSTVSFEPDSDNDSGGSAGKWLIGALIAAAIAVGGYFVWQNSKNFSTDDPTETADDVSAAMSDSMRSDTVARSLAVPAETLASRPASTSATTATTATGIATSTATDPTFNTAMTAYLNDPAQPKGRVFGLTGVSFEPSSLTLTPASQGQINELAALLKARPTLQVQLQAYANDAPGGAAGLTNKLLSFRRANVIKQQLVGAGINYLRVDAIGLGTGVRPGELGKQPLKKVNIKVITK